VSSPYRLQYVYFTCADLAVVQLIARKAGNHLTRAARYLDKVFSQFLATSNNNVNVKMAWLSTKPPTSSHHIFDAPLAVNINKYRPNKLILQLF